MAYDSTKFLAAGEGFSRQAVRSRMLVFADIHDTTDMDYYAKAARVYNGTALAVTLALVPLSPNEDSPAVILWTIPAYSTDTINHAFRRIKSTGSVNLISGGNIISGIEIILHQR